MSYGVVGILCALCAVGGFIAGMLVYRNNLRRFEEEKAALLTKIKALEEAVKK